MALADWVIKLAVSHLPADRAVWGEAMTSEYQTLQSGRLGWALGCLRATIGWRLQRDWLFLAVLVGTSLAFDYSEYLFEGAIDALAPGLLNHATIYYFWLAYPALLCGALAFWRPSYALAAACAFTLTHEAAVRFTWVFILHFPTDREIHVLDGPAVVGLSAVLGWCVAGAVIGKGLATRLRPARA